MRDIPDLISWFSDESLAPCPRCKGPRLVPPKLQQAMALCLDCGIIDLRGEAESEP
jgi:hypothetical protein